MRSNMENHNDTPIDLFFIWLGTILGHFTLSDAVLWITLVYTIFRLYVLIRNEILKKD